MYDLGPDRTSGRTFVMPGLHPVSASPNTPDNYKADSVHFNAQGDRTIGLSLYGLLAAPDAGAPVATASAAMLVPSVFVGNIVSVTAVQALASALARVPGVTATRTATVAAVQGSASAAALAPSVTAQRSSTVTAVLALAQAGAYAPTTTVGPDTPVQPYIDTKDQLSYPWLDSVFGWGTQYSPSDLIDN